MVMEEDYRMGEMQYAPVYEEWVDLMEAKDTAEKQVAFMEGIFRYVFREECPPNPREMDSPCGLDYARYDGYVVSRKTIDRMRKSVSGGVKGGQRSGTARRQEKPGGTKATPASDAGDDDGDGADRDGRAVREEAVSDEAERSCRPPFLPSEAEMLMFASNVGVPAEYLDRFLQRQREIGWEYVNRSGTVVRLNRRNFKAILRAFYDADMTAEATRRRKDAGGGGPNQPEGVVLHGEVVNDYGF